jgi:hypothetical protein
MKKTLFALAGMLVIGLPLFSFAATYHYVTTGGDVASVEADSASQALATAPNIHPNSGVAIDLGFIEVGMDVDVPPSTSGGGLYYAYVDANGTVRTVAASNPSEALLNASNLHPQSGVAVMTDGTLAE